MTEACASELLATSTIAAGRVHSTTMLDSVAISTFPVNSTKSYVLQSEIADCTPALVIAGHVTRAVLLVAAHRTPDLCPCTCWSSDAILKIVAEIVVRHFSFAVAYVGSAAR